MGGCRNNRFHFFHLNKDLNIEQEGEAVKKKHKHAKLRVPALVALKILLLCNICSHDKLTGKRQTTSMNIMVVCTVHYYK